MTSIPITGLTLTPVEATVEWRPWEVRSSLGVEPQEVVPG